jgi:MFS family permease
MRNLERNIRIIYITGFLRGLMFFLPIFALYMQQELFTLLNVALILSITAISTTIFEVPSGAFADLFGRKNTMILAGALVVISFIFLSIGTSLIFFILYAVINGLAQSLFSGTDTAIIYDSLKEMNQEHRFKRIAGITGSLWPAGAATGSFIGGFLATISLHLPVVATLIPFTLAFVLTFFLIEPKYDKETHKNILRQMRSSFSTIISNRQILLLSIAGFFIYSFAEVAHELKPVFFAFKEIPIALYGVMFAATFGLSALGYLLSPRISNRLGDKKTLLLCVSIPPITLLIATFAHGVWAAIIILLGSLFWGIQWPIITHFMHAEATSKQRVTIISFGNLANKLGLALFIPIFGYVADLSTINTAFRIAAICSFGVIGIIAFVREIPGSSSAGSHQS